MSIRLALLIVCFPALASASAANSAPDLSAALQKAKMGTTLRVESAGRPVVGRFEGIDENGLYLAGARERVTVPIQTVTAVSRMESARGRGILWGALIGLGAGALVASQADEGTISDDEREWLTYVYHGAVGALLGGAIGGVIGSTFNSWQPVYP